MSTPAPGTAGSLQNTEAIDAYLRRRRRQRDIQTNETYAAIALALATVVALLWATSGTATTPSGRRPRRWP